MGSYMKIRGTEFQLGSTANAKVLIQGTASCVPKMRKRASEWREIDEIRVWKGMKPEKWQ